MRLIFLVAIKALSRNEIMFQNICLLISTAHYRGRHTDRYIDKYEKIDY